MKKWQSKRWSQTLWCLFFTVQWFTDRFSESNTYRYECTYRLCTAKRELWDWCEHLQELLGVFTGGFPLYHGLILQASHSQVSIFSDHASSRILPEEVTLSSFLPLFPSNSLHFPYPFCSQPLFIFTSFSVSPVPFDSLSFSFHFPHPTLPLPLLFPSLPLFLHLTSSLH